MRFKRITLAGMKWWVPCLKTDERRLCFPRPRAIEFERDAWVKSHNPEVLS